MAHWLFKSEPGAWSWDDQLAKGAEGEGWNGVRNYQAANNMKAMVVGDLGFFYRRGIDVEISVESSWASVRDKLAAGIIDAAQMLAPMPLAATCGLDGIGVAMITAMSTFEEELLNGARKPSADLRRGPTSPRRRHSPTR